MARALGAAVGREGLLLGLVGPLGAGKTVFVQGLAEGLGIDPTQVASPTFVIASQHPGPRILVHADLYRIEDAGELEAAGWHDWLAPGTVLAVEWSDRFPEVFPEDRLEVSLARSSPGEETERRIALGAGGPVSRGVLARWLRDGQIPAAEDGA